MKNKYDICHGSLNLLAELVANYRERQGFETGWRNVPEKLMLIVTELSEAMEIYRHLSSNFVAVLQRNDRNLDVWFWNEWENLSQDFSPVHKAKDVVESFQEEIADAVIRLLDLASSLGINLEKQIVDKMEKNENRPYKHGKNS